MEWAPIKVDSPFVGRLAYFSHGALASVYRAVDDHVYDRVRNFLRRRHKAPGRGTTRFSRENVYEELGVLRLCRGRERSRRVPSVGTTLHPAAFSFRHWVSVAQLVF